MATNILNSYIPKFLVDLKRNNEDVITVTTQYLSTDGDVYQLDTRTVSTSSIQTTQSLQELQPEISLVFPFRGPVKLDYDNSTLMLVPSITTVPTASQDYYAPVSFERYKQDVVALIDKEFSELTV